jgi:hypothetical protein
MMQIKIKPHPNALYKGTDNWTFLQEKFKSILDGVDTKTMAYDELYGHAYSMVRYFLKEKQKAVNLGYNWTWKHFIRRSEKNCEQPYKANGMVPIAIKY